MVELLQLLAREALEKAKPDQIVAPISPKVKPAKKITEASSVYSSHVNAAKSSRYIPVPVRKRVLSQSGLRCQYVDARSGRRCDSGRYLQIDHVQPFSRGGSSRDANNLRQLCGAHNRLMWERTKVGTP